MGTLTIRNLDNRVIDALKAQAKANHRSLEAEVRYVLSQEVNHRLRMAEFRERTAQLARETADVPQTDSVELLRQDRERHEAVSDATPTVPLFHTHVVVDWSARSTPSPARPSKDAIWWAVARSGGGAVPAPRYARTRHEALEGLAAFIAAELDAGRRVLAGFDFPFGYPAGVAERLTGERSALALWDWLAARIKDKENNDNNRYDAAAAINKTYRGVVGPCWGRPATWDYPTVPVKKSQRTCREPHPPERRICDRRARGAKTVWQLAYAGSVGSQMLLGLPALARLVADPRIAGRAQVWPFETGLRVPGAQAAIAEVYPSLLRNALRTRREAGEILDRAQVRVNADAFARLDAGGGLAPLFEGAPGLAPDERRLIEAEEAWILGLGHADALEGALDPA